MTFEFHDLFTQIKYGNLNAVQIFFCQNGTIQSECLKIACKYGHYHIVEYLVHKGVNISIDNDYPLKAALLNGHTHIVNFLIYHGANKDLIPKT